LRPQPARVGGFFLRSRNGRQSFFSSLASVYSAVMRLFPLGDLSPKHHTLPERMRRILWPMIEAPFPIRSLRHRERWTQKQFVPELKRAKAQGNNEEYEHLLGLMRFEMSEHSDQLESIATQSILNKARRLHVVEAVEMAHKQENWVNGNFGARYARVLLMSSAERSPAV
jgi:hypothetical protein